jgi:hypothetical protein
MAEVLAGGACNDMRFWWALVGGNGWRNFVGFWPEASIFVAFVMGLPSLVSSWANPLTLSLHFA